MQRFVPVSRTASDVRLVWREQNDIDCAPIPEYDVLAPSHVRAQARFARYADQVLSFFVRRPGACGRHSSRHDWPRPFGSEFPYSPFLRVIIQLFSSSDHSSRVILGFGYPDWSVFGVLGWRNGFRGWTSVRGAFLVGEPQLLRSSFNCRRFVLALGGHRDGSREAETLRQST